MGLSRHFLQSIRSKFCRLAARKAHLHQGQGGTRLGDLLLLELGVAQLEQCVGRLARVGPAAADRGEGDRGLIISCAA